MYKMEDKKAIITIEQLMKYKKKKKKENIKISIEGKGEIEVSIPSLSEIQDIKAGAADSVQLQKQLIYYQFINPKLSDNQIYVSTKTSCCPVNTPSKLVYALTKDKALSSSSLRVSISYLTTKNDIDEFLRVFDVIYKEYEKDGKI